MLTQVLDTMTQRLPNELIEMVLKCLSPEECFRNSVALRFPSCFRYCVPLIPRLSIESASLHGHIDLLQWWKESGLELCYTNTAMDYASLGGQIAVLDWWKASGLDLRYTKYAMSNASWNGHVLVLDWWKASGLELRYNCDALKNACFKGMSVVRWWRESGLKISLTFPA